MGRWLDQGVLSIVTRLVGFFYSSFLIMIITVVIGEKSTSHQVLLCRYRGSEAATSYASQLFVKCIQPIIYAGNPKGESKMHIHINDYGIMGQNSDPAGSKLQCCCSASPLHCSLFIDSNFLNSHHSQPWAFLVWTPMTPLPLPIVVSVSELFFPPRQQC